MSGHRGFTIIEVMVSIGIFGIVTAMMASSMVQMQRAQYENEIRSQAYAAAQQRLDYYRSQDPGDTSIFPTTGFGTAVDVVLDGHTFSVRPQFCATPALCISSTVKGVKLVVSHKNIPRYTVETVFARLQ